jgi:endogenous inhibitor of DNA gyrase (YacG/DUF329 family)
MAGKEVRSLRCPTCRTLVLAGSENFPFCSERCRLIDLGKWASGGYVVSTPITDPEMLESIVEEQSHKKSDGEEERSKHGE